MHHDTADMTESAAHMATDPVCGMKVDLERARARASTMRGETYWFCSAGLPHQIRRRTPSAI